MRVDGFGRVGGVGVTFRLPARLVWGEMVRSGWSASAQRIEEGELAIGLSADSGDVR
jgi:hypothetical protein